jgi:hypothetical protein
MFQGAKQIPFGGDNKKSKGNRNGKSKRLRGWAAFSDLYISIIGSRVELTCSEFSAVFALCFVWVVGFSTVSGT